jgi:DNA-binding LytR/AlgR family response regulator
MLESAPLRLLIADDEPAARELLRVYAARRSDAVVVGESEDGPRAVDAIIALRPERVLLDVEMPAMDGFTVLAELARRRIASPRVVFVTAFDRYAVRAFEANAVDYLLKPVTFERFGQAIDRCLCRPDLVSTHAEWPARRYVSPCSEEASRPRAGWHHSGPHRLHRLD